METILNYIDTMFAGVPATEETKRLREDITANMTDKFDELIKDGKSGNEAVGTVISEFGNIDEVLKEMGIERSTNVSAPKSRRTLAPEKLWQLRMILFGVLCAFASAAAALSMEYIIKRSATWEYITFSPRFMAAFLAAIALFGGAFVLYDKKLRSKYIPAAVTDILRAKKRKRESLYTVGELLPLLAEVLTAWYMFCATVYRPTHTGSYAGQEAHERDLYIIFVVVVIIAECVKMYAFSMRRLYNRILGEKNTPFTGMTLMSIITPPYFLFLLKPVQLSCFYDRSITAKVYMLITFYIFMFAAAKIYDKLHGKIKISSSAREETVNGNDT